MNVSASGIPSRDRRRLVALGLGVATAATVILFLFDPETSRFYPVCLLHEVTGWECPACGGLRAVHQLTHGHLAAAWNFNPLVVLLSPVGAWLALREIVRESTGHALPGLVTRPIFGWLTLVAVVLFGILRNIW